MNDAKEKIRAALDIADVIGEVVALKPSGRGQLKGLCPFHNEKTPSFHVHQDKGFYYCFGCQAKGDMFDFMMQSQGLPFYEALQTLGQRAGIEVSPPTAKSAKRRDLTEVNKLAVEFYRSQLKDGALEYVHSRQLTPESIDTFDLGYAPDAWDGLLKHALTKGVDEKDLLDAGLIRENKTGRRYDYFRNRVMFPIKDYLGRVVGFSGRVLDDSMPKYLNTAETDIFKKAELLYGLDLAKQAIRESGEALVVEGYMDVIALRQTGFMNSVAALGATLTAEQASQLSRLDVQKLYLAFDADEAGQRAILSGLEQSVGRDFLVKAIQVPHGKDPADAVLGGHIEDFRAALNEGISEIEFRISAVLKKYNTTSERPKQAALEELLPSMIPHHLGGQVTPKIATEMRQKVVHRLNVDEQQIDYLIKAYRKNKNRRIDNLAFNAVSKEGKQRTQTTIIELEVMALLLLEPHYLERRLEIVLGSLPPNAQAGLLVEFIENCKDCAYQEQAILERYHERDEGRVLYERLLQKPSEDERRIDVDGAIEKDLSRLRELYLTAEKEQQRQHLLERMEEVSRYLTDPALPTEQLMHYYAELKEIQTSLAARQAERQMRAASMISKRR